MGLAFSVLSGAAISVTYAFFHYDFWPDSFLWSWGGILSEQFYPWETPREQRNAERPDRSVLKLGGMMPKPCYPCTIQTWYPWGSFLTDPSIDYLEHRVDGHINATAGSEVSLQSNTKIYPADIPSATSKCTPITGISRKGLIGVREYISTRLTGSKTKLYSETFDPAKDYNKTLFASGTPWQRARADLTGYYYWQPTLHAGSKEASNSKFNSDGTFPFLPPRVGFQQTRDYEKRGYQIKQFPEKQRSGLVSTLFDTIKSRGFRAYDLDETRRIAMEYPGSSDRTYALTHLAFNPEDLQYRAVNGQKMKMKAGAIV